MQFRLPFSVDPRLPFVRASLLAVHGLQRDELRHDPTTQFVKAMVSACTPDAISNAAFMRLRALCSSWDQLADIDPDALAAFIRDVTHPDQKARYLVAAARQIRAERGGLDLGFLADRSVEDALVWLCRLRGIKSKTAAAIVNFSTLRKRALVVDRHVLRVSKRLGLLPERAGFERGFRMLMRLVPQDWDADDLYELHWLMKMHSQTRCRLHRPVCDGCPLARHCPAAARYASPSFL